MRITFVVCLFIAWVLFLWHSAWLLSEQILIVNVTSGLVRIGETYEATGEGSGRFRSGEQSYVCWADAEGFHLVGSRLPDNETLCLIENGRLTQKLTRTRAKDAHEERLEYARPPCGNARVTPSPLLLSSRPNASK